MFDVLPVVAIFAIGAASPGPANVLIMTTSMQRGRKAGIQSALGILVTSAAWGLIAISGLAALLQRSVMAFSVIKIVGAIYLLYLSFRMFKAATESQSASVAEPGGRTSPFLSGVLLHATNPKAPLVWAATVSAGVPGSVPVGTLWAGYAGCVILGALIFTAYAIIFSTPAAMSSFVRLKRAINLVAGGLFGLAGIKMAADEIT